MAITQEGIIFSNKRKRGFGLSFFVFLELLLSLILVVSLSANLIFPQQTLAGTGISQKLSYQGRLTDLSGNTLGGATGTNYCFRFSIYDAPTGGAQKWPSGTPTTETVKVKDGAFATAIGNSASLSFDFTTLKSSYLNVEVNRTPTTCGGAWEQLDVRQRIDAVAYARAAELVYGDLLRVASGSGVVQIGTGSGTGTPVYLGLDQKNVADSVDGSCSNNGQIWYTAAGKNRFRVCQGSTIQDMVGGLLIQDSDVNVGRASAALDFQGAGVSVINNSNGIISVNIPFAGIAAGGSTVSSGSIVFSNLNGVSFGFNGSTITASVNAGGGGATLSGFEPFHLANPISTTYAPGIGTWYMQPFVAPEAIASGRLNALLSYSNSSNGILMASNGASFASNTTGTRSISYILSHDAALYSRGAGGNSSRLDSFWSNTWTLGIVESVSVVLTNATQVRASLTASLSYIASVGSNGGYTTSSMSGSGSQSSAGASMATSALSSVISSLLNVLSGQMLIPIGFNTSIPPGQYWLGQAWSTAQTTGGTSIPNILPLVNKVAIYGISSMPYRAFGLTVSNSSSQFWPGEGMYSVVSASAPASMPFVDIRSVASHLTQYFNIVNITI